MNFRSDRQVLRLGACRSKGGRNWGEQCGCGETAPVKIVPFLLTGIAFYLWGGCAPVAGWWFETSKGYNLLLWTIGSAQQLQYTGTSGLCDIID